MLEPTPYISMSIFGSYLRFVDWFLKFIWNLGFDNWYFIDLSLAQILRLTAMELKSDRPVAISYLNMQQVARQCQFSPIGLSALSRNVRGKAFRVEVCEEQPVHTC